MTILQHAPVIDSELEKVEHVFFSCFGESHRTRLRGGGVEPLYLPASNAAAFSEVIYREDYFNSALHEMAHWCIAGPERRQQPDYGYWYSTDDRDLASQRRFEQVEVAPQALEWQFSIACGRVFSVSLDSPGQFEDRRAAFRQKVAARAMRDLKEGVGQRADILISALIRNFGGRRACADDFGAIE